MYRLIKHPSTSMQPDHFLEEETPLSLFLGQSSSKDAFRPIGKLLSSDEVFQDSLVPRASRTCKHVVP